MSLLSNYIETLPAVTASDILEQITSLAYIKTHIGGYFFDATFKTTHSTNLKITSHPVQGAANISDHCYLEPATVSVELGMSDVGNSILSGQFSDASSRSQSAFDALGKMQQDRQPITILTKFKTYENMLIENLVIVDDVKTAFGLKANVALKQIITVNVAEVKQVSARPQVNTETNSGKVVAVTPKETLASKIETAMGG